MLHAQAEKVQEGLDALHTWAEGGETAQRERVKQIEREADELRRIVIEELNQTFVTPFDREDIFDLSRTIDDVIDYAYSTVSEMEILKVGPTPFMLQMASLLRDGAYELVMAVDCLEEHPRVTSEHAHRAKSLENKVENVYREALADLFSDVEDIEHVVKMLKQREVYRHLSNAADRGDEAANVLANIVVKIA